MAQVPFQNRVLNAPHNQRIVDPGQIHYMDHRWRDNWTDESIIAHCRFLHNTPHDTALVRMRWHCGGHQNMPCSDPKLHMTVDLYYQGVKVGQHAHHVYPLGLQLTDRMASHELAQLMMAGGVVIGALAQRQFDPTLPAGNVANPFAGMIFNQAAVQNNANIPAGQVQGDYGGPQVQAGQVAAPPPPPAAQQNQAPRPQPRPNSGAANAAPMQPPPRGPGPLPPAINGNRVLAIQPQNQNAARIQALNQQAANLRQQIAARQNPAPASASAKTIESEDSTIDTQASWYQAYSREIDNRYATWRAAHPGQGPSMIDIYTEVFIGTIPNSSALGSILDDPVGREEVDKMRRRREIRKRVAQVAQSQRSNRSSRAHEGSQGGARASVRGGSNRTARSDSPVVLQDLAAQALTAYEDEPAAVIRPMQGVNNGNNAREEEEVLYDLEEEDDEDDLEAEWARLKREGTVDYRPRCYSNEELYDGDSGA